MADDLYYGDASLNKRLFCATAIVTAPVIYSTATGTGGPLLWNSSRTVLGRLIKVGWGLSTAATAAGALGLTGGTGQSSAPTSTTAIDTVTNCYIGGPAPAITPYRIGTVAAAGTFLIPFASVTTGAITVAPDRFNWVHLDRTITIPSGGGWCSVAASATLSSAVITIALMWEEIPLPG